MDIRCCALHLAAPSLLSFPFHEKTWEHMQLSKHTATLHIHVYLHAFLESMKVNIHFDSSNLTHTHTCTHTFMDSLLSVTYHLPLDFWTSLLFKLCDLAVHTVEQKTQNPGQEVIECVCVCKKEGGKAVHALYSINYVSVCAACFCLCMLSTIKQVALYRFAIRPWSPPQRNRSATTLSLTPGFSCFYCATLMVFVSPCAVHPPYTLSELSLF